jgi:hypothetical protein
MLSLLGNHKLNTSMETLVSLVLRWLLLHGNQKQDDDVYIGPARCYIEKTRHNRVQFSSISKWQEFSSLPALS